MLCEEAGLLLSELLEEKLSPSMREAVQEHVQTCAQCQRDFAQLQQWQAMARQWQDDAVPKWSQARFALPTAHKTPWWNWASLASSSLALLLVLTQLSVHSDDKGFHIAIGKSNTPQLTEAQVDEKLAAFAKVQQAKFDNRMMEIELTQIESDKRLLAAALNITREQTRDDYEQLVSYWQTVRQQDLSSNQTALRRLYSAQQTELNTLKANFRRTSVPEEL